MTVLEDLAAVFGSSAETAKDAAATSRRFFARGQDHLFAINDSDDDEVARAAACSADGTARIFNAAEALELFGYEALHDAVFRGSAILAEDRSEPARTLSDRRAALGLGLVDVSSATGLDVEAVRRAEDARVRSPIGVLERIAQLLSLDERLLTVRPGADGDPDLGYRMRRLRDQSATIGPRTVRALSEAAWVVRRQVEFSARMGETFPLRDAFSPSSNYGDHGYPAWKHGMWLASEARRLLEISEGEPIPSVRKVTARLGIPVVLAPAPAWFAGATVCNRGVRGIFLNSRGLNSRVSVRRSTLAHELGHLLWDPDAVLDSLIVDDYSRLDQDYRDLDQNLDAVEARANAFAVELLAPQSAIVEHAEVDSRGRHDVGPIMRRFGVSKTAARYHYWNAIDRAVEFRNVVGSGPSPEANTDWRAAESWTADWYPLANVEDPRRGRFAALAAKTFKKGAISKGTVASCLGVAEILLTAGVIDQIASLDEAD